MKKETEAKLTELEGKNNNEGTNTMKTTNNKTVLLEMYLKYGIVRGDINGQNINKQGELNNIKERIIE